MTLPMAQALREKLTPLYQRLLGPLFDRPEVVEERATCDDCVMCDKGQSVPIETEFFHPDVKCCTWMPTLANYLVGGLFTDPSPELEEGRTRVRKVIASRIGVTPQWIAPSRKYSLLNLASKKESFGKTPLLRCPYYNVEAGGMCSVWRYRDNVCSTWFCKHTWGKQGWEFWRAAKHYLGHVELMLSHYAMKTVDHRLKEPAVERQTITLRELEDRPPSDEDYASYWGGWVGREEEWYVACYEAVNKVPKEEFLRFVDGEEPGRYLLHALRTRWDQLNNQALIPAVLLKNPKMKDRYVDDGVVITSYSPYDSFKMDRDLFDVLGFFDAKRSVDETLERLSEEHGAELTPELLQYLYRHGVLVEPGDDPTLLAPDVPPPPPARPIAAKIAAKKDKKKKKRR